jgi:membrane-associated phospholipid phosphatase
VATVVASEYKEHALVPPVAYGVALLTALSRVNDNKHWTSDVLFGSVTGYFIARSVINLHSGKKRSRISVLPAIDAGRTALMLSYRF